MLIKILQEGEEKEGISYIGKDETPIQRALKYLKDNKTKGSIYITSGDYSINSPLIVHSGVKIYGDYVNTRLIPKFNTDGNNSILYVKGSESSPVGDVFISKLYLGNPEFSSKGKLGKFGVNVHYSSYISTSVGVTLEDLYIEGNRNSGIYLQNSQGVTVRRNIIKDNSETNSGIYLTESTTNKITENKVINTAGSSGIYLVKSKGNLISSNFITSSQKVFGIYLNFSTNNLLEGNIIKDNGNDGIYFSNSNDNSIVGNTVLGNSYDIRLTQSNRNIINGNVVKTTGYNGSSNLTNLNVTATY